MDEMAETIRILRQAEMEIEHRLVGHDAPVDDCAVCRAHGCDSTALRTSNGPGGQLWRLVSAATYS